MTVAICIGAYRLAEFVELNLCQCLRLFGEDTLVLVSDDRSPNSDAIKAIADKHGAGYVVGEKRCSHFSGDLQCFINASKFGELTGCDVIIKISQRFVPAHEQFVNVLLSPFEEPGVAMVFPGQPKKNQMARPGAMFYSGFGLLTDCVAWRPKELMAGQIESFYRDQLTDVTDQKKGKHLVEVTFGRIAAKLLDGRIRSLDALANHHIGKPKLFLRKAQSNRGEYINLAKQHGIEGDFDVREWAAIEGKDYLPIGAII